MGVWDLNRGLLASGCAAGPTASLWGSAFGSQRTPPRHLTQSQREPVLNLLCDARVS